MESVVIDGSPSYATRTRFGSVDRSGLLISKSFNATCSNNSFLGPKNPTFNANYYYVHQPPLLPLPSTGIRRSAFPQRAGNKKPFYREARDVVVVVTDNNKSKEEETVSSSLSCSVSPPPSSVPMPRFVITRKKATTTTEGSGGGVDVRATDGLRRLLRISN